MIFNCLECAKSISTRMDHCPYCSARTAQIATSIESSQQKDMNASLWERIKGTVAGAVIGS